MLYLDFVSSVRDALHTLTTKEKDTERRYGGGDSDGVTITTDFGVCQEAHCTEPTSVHAIQK